MNNIPAQPEIKVKAIDKLTEKINKIPGISLVLTLTLIIIVILIFYFSSKLLIQTKNNLKIRNNSDNLINTLATQPIPTISHINNFSILNNYRNIINDGEILIEKDGKLFFLNTNTMELKNIQIDKFENFSDIAISNDGRYLSSTFSDQNDYHIIIYDLENKKIINKIKGESFANPRVEQGHISPNNKYFIVTTSCCPGDVGRGIYNLQGSLIKQLTGGETLWSLDGTQFAISKGSLLRTSFQ